MSNLSRVTNEEVIDLTAPQTPPPNQRSKDGPGSAQLSSLASPNASFYSPPPGQHTGEEGSAYNNPSAASQNQQGAGAARWSSQTVYLRVMGRKAGTANNELSLAKPFKATPLNYSLMGLFSKESNEERQIRHMLKSYKSTLVAELQHCSKASVRHKKRVADQFAEFEVHEGKLVGWGLKFIIPFFRMQAWSRLSRSTLMRDLSLELEQVMSQRVAKTSLFLTTFEESINRKNKFSIAMTEEFCMRPDTLLDRDVGLITMTQQLQSLDDICSSTTKRFMQFESEYAWHGQAMRRKILLRILKRYKTIPQISELTNIEEDLQWSDFCLWYANRNKIINQLVLEYSDFVEDQREKEGRLFYRWHKSLFRAKEAYEAAEAAGNSQDPNSTGAVGEAGAGINAGAGSNLRRGSHPRVSISAINSFRLVDGSTQRGPTTSFSGAPQNEGDGPGGGEGGDTKERGFSSDSIEGGDPSSTANTVTTAAGAGGSVPAAPTSTSSPAPSSGAGANNSNSGNIGTAAPSSAAAAPAPGAPTAGGPSDGIIALKVTPFSIKAFIKYFANDIIGVQYEIPKDCMAANLALVEALFFRRIHSHIYQYNSPQMYTNDQAWRQQCQLCRFVDPTTYHVPPKYAAARSTSTGDADKPGTSTTAGASSKVDGKGDGKHCTASPPRSTTPPPAHYQPPMETIQEERHADQFDDHSRVSDDTPTHRDNAPPAASIPAPAAVDTEVEAVGLPLHEAAESAPTLSLRTPAETTAAEGAGTSSAAAPLEDTSPPPPPPTETLTSHQKGSASDLSSNASATGKSSPSRLKMRLVSDDSTIYKTCFNENSGASTQPQLNVTENMSSMSRLRASFGGFGSPKSSNRKTADSTGRNSLSHLPADLIADLPVMSNAPAENPMSPEQDKVSSYSFGAAKTEQSGYQDSPVPDTSEFDAADSVEANNISSYKMGGEAVSDVAPGVSALDQIAAIKGSPQLAGQSPQYGSTLKSLHGSSASVASRRKHHNSASPRSYLTANALKANDRALSTPGCACKMCATFAASARLARLPKYSEGQYGVAYARSSRVMSFLTTASTPGEIISILALASKWLLRDAIDASGSRDTIGADLLVPLFTMVLINAQLPNVHMILQVLLDYGEYNEQGDVSYTIANLEGSILFILGLDVPVHARSAYESCAFALANPAFIASNRHGRNGSMSRDIKSKYSSDALSEMSHATTATTGYNDSGGMQNNSSSTPAFTEMSFAVKGKGEHTEEDVVAMKQLGEWLRDQNTMEDTITILQKEGWMA